MSYLDRTTVTGNDQLLVAVKPENVDRVVIAASQDQVTQNPTEGQAEEGRGRGQFWFTILFNTIPALPLIRLKENLTHYQLAPRTGAGADRSVRRHRLRHPNCKCIETFHFWHSGSDNREPTYWT